MDEPRPIIQSEVSQREEDKYCIQMNIYRIYKNGNEEVISVQFTQSSDSSRLQGPQHTGLPVHHQLLEFTQTHVHHVSDAIKPSYPL